MTQDIQEVLYKLAIETAEYNRNAAMYAAATGNQDYQAAQVRVKQEEVKLQNMRNWARPSIFLQADLSREEREKAVVWIASAKGVYAEGNSPEQAFLAFDDLWTQGESQ